MEYLVPCGPLDSGISEERAGVSSIDPGAPGQLPLGRFDEPTSTIEELGGADPPRATGWTDRRIGLAIAAGAAVICLGFAGRAWGPLPPGTAIPEATSCPSVGQVVRPTTHGLAPSTPVSPAVGETTDGGLLSVHGIADGSLRDVQFVVVLDEVVLRSANVRPAAAGPTRTEIPLSAPRVGVPADFLVSVAMMDGATDRLTRGRVLGAGQRVSFWRSVATERSGGDVGLVVDGDAPSTVDLVTIDIRTRSGRLLASAVAPNGTDDERPASDGGRRRELGRFEQLIVVPGPIPTGGWQVEITWAPASDGSNGAAARVVSAH